MRRHGVVGDLLSHRSGLRPGPRHTTERVLDTTVTRHGKVGRKSIGFVVGTRKDGHCTGVEGFGAVGRSEHDERVGIVIGENGCNEKITSDVIGRTTLTTQIRHDETVIVDDGGFSCFLVVGQHGWNGETVGGFIKGVVLKVLVALLGVEAGGGTAFLSVVKVFLDVGLGRRGALDTIGEAHGVKGFEAHMGKRGKIVLDFIGNATTHDTGGEGGLGVTGDLVDAAGGGGLIGVGELGLVVLGVGPATVIDKRVDFGNEFSITPPVFLGGFFTESGDEIGADPEKSDPRHEELNGALRGRRHLFYVMVRFMYVYV